MGIRGRDFVLDCLIMTTSANILSLSDRIEVHEIGTFNASPSSFLNNIAFIAVQGFGTIWHRQKPLVIYAFMVLFHLP